MTPPIDSGKGSGGHKTVAYTPVADQEASLALAVEDGVRAEQQSGNRTPAASTWFT